jgi:hypothetical protein
MSSVFLTSLVHAVEMTYLVAGKEKGGDSGVRNILIESRETQATYSHIITYHSMRVDAKMMERGMPHIVVSPGNS